MSVLGLDTTRLCIVVADKLSAVVVVEEGSLSTLVPVTDESLLSGFSIGGKGLLDGKSAKGARAAPSGSQRRGETNPLLDQVSVLPLTSVSGASDATDISGSGVAVRVRALGSDASPCLIKLRVVELAVCHDLVTL